MRIPESLGGGLQSEKTSKAESTNPLPNSTKKQIEPRQYDDAPQEAQKTQENGITACISFERDLPSYVPLKFSASQQRRALIDTGANANAISEKDYQELKSFGTATPSEVKKVKVASRQLIPVRGQIELAFSIAKHSFKLKLLDLPITKIIVLGKPFFKNNSKELHPKKTS